LEATIESYGVSEVILINMALVHQLQKSPFRDVLLEQLNEKPLAGFI